MGFNFNKYRQEYNKEHYKTFKVDLRTDEMEQLEEILEKTKLTKAQFLRYCIMVYSSEIDRQSTDTSGKKV